MVIKRQTIRIKAFLGNGNTTLVNLYNVPNNETIRTIKSRLQLILGTKSLTMMVYAMDEHQTAVECRDSDFATPTLLVFLRVRRNARLEGLGFRPSSARACNRTSTIDYNCE